MLHALDFAQIYLPRQLDIPQKFAQSPDFPSSKHKTNDSAYNSCHYYQYCTKGNEEMAIIGIDPPIRSATSATNDAKKCIIRRPEKRSSRTIYRAVTASIVSNMSEVKTCSSPTFVSPSSFACLRSCSLTLIPKWSE
jgi:hypothetical protein